MYRKFIKDKFEILFLNSITECKKKNESDKKIWVYGDSVNGYIETLTSLYHCFRRKQAQKMKEEDKMIARLVRSMLQYSRPAFRSFVAFLLLSDFKANASGIQKHIRVQTPVPNTKTISFSRSIPEDPADQLEELFYRIAIDVLKIFFRLKYFVFGLATEDEKRTTVATLPPTEETEMIRIVNLNKEDLTLSNMMNVDYLYCHKVFDFMWFVISKIESENKDKFSQMRLLLRFQIQDMLSKDIVSHLKCDEKEEQLANHFFCVSILPTLKTGIDQVLKCNMNDRDSEKFKAAIRECFDALQTVQHDEDLFRKLKDLFRQEEGKQKTYYVEK